MPLEDDILLFKEWANKMGCPVENIPEDQALKSFFKLSQSLLISNIIEKVGPCQKVLEMRQNIVLYKMEKIKNQIVPTCGRSFLPKEMQRYLKIESLKKKKQEAEKRLKETKSECDALSTFIKNKNVQKLKLKQNENAIEVRVNILELKDESLENDIKKEKSNKEHIKTYMPIKMISSNSSEARATEATLEAIKELEKFYEISLNNSNCNDIQEAEEDLWNSLRKIFSNIPNVLLWSIACKMKYDQLQNIISLNKNAIQKNVYEDEKDSFFDKQILKSQAHVISTFAKYVRVKKDREDIDNRFVEIYPKFVTAIKQKVTNSTSKEAIEEIVVDYLIQYNMKNFFKNRNDILTCEIENCRLQIKEGNRKLKDHIEILAAIKETYVEIESVFQRIEYEMIQLNQIKEKILCSKSITEFMMKNIQTSHQTTFSKNKGIMNISPENFSFSDNFFSSTKLDWDSPCSITLRSNTTIARIDSSLPQHLLEISTFMNTPIEKLSSIPKECKWYLSPNPLVLESKSISIMQTAPGLLLTSEGVIEEVKSKCNWNEKINKISTEPKFFINPIKVNENALKQQRTEQREQLTEILDKIDITAVKSNRALKKCNKYYNFLLENPLKKYVPKTKLFNNRTYSDYESEFQMYYRMAKLDSSNSN